VRTVQSVVVDDGDDGSPLTTSHGTPPTPPSAINSVAENFRRTLPAPSFGSSPNLMLLGESRGRSFNSMEDGVPTLQEIDEGQNLSEPKRLLLQEVTVAGLDKPMRLTTLSASVCDVGLNVREAHVFSTKNGYLLDIFVTDPLPGVDAEDLEDLLFNLIV